MKRLVLLITFIALCPSTGFSGEGHQHGPDGSHIGPGFDSEAGLRTVTLSPDRVETLGIETITIKSESIAPTSSLLGKIVVDPRRSSKVGARFSGRIDKLYVLSGDRVSREEELLKVTPLQVGSRSVRIQSPIDGYISELEMTVGQAFSESDTLLEVSDLSRVLFEGDLFDQKLSAKVTQATGCSVSLSYLPNERIQCRVRSVDAKLRGSPPVAHVYAEIQNADLRIKPGMTGSLELGIGEQKPRLLVPTDALLGQFDQRFVFVRKGNEFHRTEVTLGKSFGDRSEIAAGLDPGVEIVIQGHYQLQFVSSSDSGDGHDHHGDHDHGHSHTGDHKHDHGHDHEHDHKHEHHGDHKH